MFNGVGLTTPRGSGTNGYVQKSLATLRPVRIAKGHDQQGVITRPKLRTNPEIALHEKLRALEVKLLELRVLKEGQMSTEELDKLIANERQRLMKLLEQDSMAYDRRENDSNQLAEDKARRNQKMKEALKIKDTDHGAKPRDVEAEDQGTSLGERDETISSVSSTPSRSRSHSMEGPKSPSHSAHSRDVERSASRSGTPYRERRHIKKYKRSSRSYSADSDVSRGSHSTRRQRYRRSRSVSNSRPSSHGSSSSERDTDRSAERSTERDRMRRRERSRRHRSPSRSYRKRRGSAHKSYRSTSRSVSSRPSPSRSHSDASHDSSVSRSHTPQHRKGDRGRSNRDRNAISTRDKTIHKDRSRSRSNRARSRSYQIERRRSHSSGYRRRHSMRYSSRKYRRSSSSSVSSSRSPHETRRAELRHRDSRKSKSSSRSRSRSRSRTHDRHSRSLSRAPGNYERNDDGSVTDSSMEHSDG